MNIHELGKISDGLHFRAFLRNIKAINSQNPLIEIDEEALASKIKVIANNLQPRIIPDCTQTTIDGLKAKHYMNAAKIQLSDITNICYDYSNGKRIR